MIHTLSLNILRPDDGYGNITNVQPTINTLSPSTEQKEGIYVLPTDFTYLQFVNFMLDPQYIRFSIEDRIQSNKLTDLFNESTGLAISSNSIFPKLMKRFMDDYPQYGILKKSMTKGITYFYVGNAKEEIHGKKYPTKTIEERNNNVRDMRHYVLNNVMDAICQRASWTHLEYQRMVDLDFVTIVSLGGTINIEATIKICEGKLVEHIYKILADIISASNYAEIVKRDFVACTKSDINLTPINSSKRYQDRLLAAERTYDAGDKLQSTIREYERSVIGLPILDYIVYPNIQYLRELSEWLKANSKFNVERRMAREHKAFEYEEDVDIETDETKAKRLIDAEVLVTHIMSHV